MLTSHKLIYFINFSRKLTVNSMLFLIPLYFLKIGLNGWEIGLIIAVYAAAPFFFSAFMGWLNDRFSIRKTVRLALFIQSGIFMTLIFVRHFYGLLPLFLLLGITNNGLDMSMNSLYYKDAAAIDQNKKYGIYNFWMAFGIALGTLAGGMLIELFTFSHLFLFYTVLLWGIRYPTKYLGEGRFETVSVRDYRLELINLKTILFAVMIFLLSLHWGVESTVYSPFLREFLHLERYQIALFMSIPLFVLALASYLMSLRRYDPRANRKVFLLAMFLSGTGQFLMVNRSVPLAFVFRVLHEAGDGILGVLIILYVSRLFKPRSIGGSSGILWMIMVLGHMVGALVFSSIGYRFGLQYPFLVSGLILVLDSVFGMYVFRKWSY
ncbi:MAG: MFS transporter [Candidatus Aminicenantaceae bacterium]